MLEKKEKVIVLDSNWSPDIWTQNASLLAHTFETQSRVRGLYLPAKTGELTNALKRICSFKVPGELSFSNPYHKFKISHFPHRHFVPYFLITLKLDMPIFKVWKHENFC